MMTTERMIPIPQPESGYFRFGGHKWDWALLLALALLAAAWLAHYKGG